MSEVAQLLQAASAGNAQAAAELLPLVDNELCGLAAQKLTSEARSHTLHPAALLHEAWLRLGGGELARFENRAHFFGAAAEAMRRILIERVRRRQAARCGNGSEPLDVDLIEIPSSAGDDETLLRANDAQAGWMATFSADVDENQRSGSEGKDGKQAAMNPNREIFQSARGLAQSKTWRTHPWLRPSRSVLDCGSPPPLFPAPARAASTLTHAKVMREELP